MYSKVSIVLSPHGDFHKIFTSPPLIRVSPHFTIEPLLLPAHFFIKKLQATTKKYTIF